VVLPWLDQKWRAAPWPLLLALERNSWRFVGLAVWDMSLCLSPDPYLPSSLAPLKIALRLVCHPQPAHQSCSSSRKHPEILIVVILQYLLVASRKMKEENFD
jgi:hypothetical protein